MQRIRQEQFFYLAERGLRFLAPVICVRGGAGAAAQPIDSAHDLAGVLGISLLPRQLSARKQQQLQDAVCAAAAEAARRIHFAGDFAQLTRTKQQEN